MAISRESFKKAIIEAKKQSGDRKFKQSLDIAINLKLLPKGTKIEEHIQLPQGRAKPAKICGLVSAELKDQASKLCDSMVLADDFPKWTDKRKIKKLLSEHHFFIAQANIMAQVAKTFGKYMGPRGKMPNPKAGQIVPPKVNLEPIVKKLKATVVLKLTKSPVLHTTLGSQELDDDKLAENAYHIYEAILHVLPNHDQNIASMFVKTTMGKAVKVA